MCSFKSICVKEFRLASVYHNHTMRNDTPQMPSDDHCSEDINFTKYIKYYKTILYQILQNYIISNITNYTSIC